LGLVDYLITDDKINPKHKKLFKENDIQLIIAPKIK
jgi:DeoR/GlpR family transcriptional regulator of sugar metabolism